MPDLSGFPITRRWPVLHPERIQLYSLNTPNGVKASIMLEDTGLPYEPHLVDIMQSESHTPEFVSLNPTGKIPAMIDPDGPGGQPLGLFESGAILLYLAEHRPDRGHLEEHPLDRLPPPRRVGGDETAGLVGQVQQDRAGLEQPQRLSAGAVGVDHRGDLAVGVERHELGRVALALHDVD